MMGFMDYASDLCWLPETSHNKHKKRRQLQTMEIKVRMDCEGCENKVRRAVEGLEGASTIEIDLKQNKLTLTGYVNAAQVLRVVRWKTGKNAELWSYVSYDVVVHPYAPGAYHKKVPAEYVRNVMDNLSAAPLARASSTGV